MVLLGRCLRRFGGRFAILFSCLVTVLFLDCDAFGCGMARACRFFGHSKGLIIIISVFRRMLYSSLDFAANSRSISFSSSWTLYCRSQCRMSSGTLANPSFLVIMSSSSLSTVRIVMLFVFDSMFYRTKTLVNKLFYGEKLQTI